MVADRPAPLFTWSSFTPVTVTGCEVPELLVVNVSDVGFHPGDTGHCCSFTVYGHVAPVGCVFRLTRVGGRTARLGDRLPRPGATVIPSSSVTVTLTLGTSTSS